MALWQLVTLGGGGSFVVDSVLYLHRANPEAYDSSPLAFDLGLLRSSPPRPPLPSSQHRESVLLHARIVSDSFAVLSLFLSCRVSLRHLQLEFQLFPHSTTNLALEAETNATNARAIKDSRAGEGKRKIDSEDCEQREARVSCRCTKFRTSAGYRDRNKV